MGISVINLCFLREGVGVKNLSLKKMAEMISLQGFYGFFVFIASRTLHSQGFSYFTAISGKRKAQCL